MKWEDMQLRWNPETVRIFSPDGSRVLLVLPRSKWTVVDASVLTELPQSMPRQREQSQRTSSKKQVVAEHAQAILTLLKTGFLDPADEGTRRACEDAAILQSGRDDSLLTDQHTAAIIRLTTRCNLRCPFCTTPPDQAKGPPFVSLQTIDRIAEALSKRKSLVTVTLSGGEPLLHPSLLEIMSTLRPKATNRTCAVCLAIPQNRHPGIWTLGDSVDT